MLVQNQSNRMVLRVPKEETFLSPEGIFPATIVDVRSYLKKIVGGKEEEFLRIVWDLNIAHSDHIQYKAGKNYPPTLGKGSELREDLETLGIQFNESLEFDLRTIIGRRADLQIKHISNEGYGNPFVYIYRIAPLGSLTGTGNGNDKPLLPGNCKN